MVYPKYIKGTSLYGYHSQMVAVNAFDSRALFANRNRKFKRRKSPVYIKGFFTETYSAKLANFLPDIIPVDKLIDIRDSVAEEIAPFTDSLSTYDIFAERELKYCPKCLERGEHYVYQQLKISQKCREHGLDLVKGCPVCGAALPSSIEIETKLPFGCSDCNERLIKFPTPVSFLVQLIERADEEPKHLKKPVLFNEEAGYVISMGGAENVFEDGGKGYSFLKEYLKTGKKPKPSLIVKKDDVPDYSLSQLVIPFTDGKLPKSSNKVRIRDYIADSEMTGKSVEERAAAYLCRMLYEEDNPRRLGVRALKQVVGELKTGIKASGLENHVKLLTKAIIEHYLAETYHNMIECLKRNTGKSFLLMAHEKLLPVVNYGIVILEDEKQFYIYLFQAAV